MNINIVVCHPVEDKVSDVFPGLVRAEDDEEGEEGGHGGDHGEHGDHLHSHLL